MFGLPVADLLVIAVYFLIVLAIGVWASRRVRGEEDFFLAGRRFGKFIQTFAAFGQGTSADNAVGVSTTTFHNGASGIWSSMLYLFGTPVYWFTSAWMRRLRIITMGDFFVERYGSRRMAALYSVIGSVGMMAFIALGFNAMAKTVVAITPKDAVQFTAAEAAEYQAAFDREIRNGAGGPAALLSLAELREKQELGKTAANKLAAEQQARLEVLQSRRPATVISHLKLEALVWAVSIIVMLYAAAGGLEAAFLTDTLQGIGIIILSIILIPFAWARINVIYGGEGMGAALATIHARLPDSYFDVFGSPHAIDFTWYYIIALSVMALLTVIIQPNMLVSNGSARDEYAARYGFVVGSYMKRFCTVLWGVFGLAAIVLYSSTVQHSDLVWGYATRDLLGPLGLGLVGLMIACLMAALMSTADCLMLTCSSLLTHNLYRPIRPGRTEQVRIDFVPKRRGVVQFRDPRVLLPDPFGLFQRCRKVQAPVDQLIVLPKRYRLPPLNLPGDACFQLGGEAVTNTIGLSGEFLGLRDYRSGDALRHIHWKGWAKTGRPIVKEFENTYFPRYGLVLDNCVESGDEEVFEEAVSVAASFASAIDTKRSLLDLMFIKDEAIVMTAGQGLAKAEKMLEVLAGVEAEREEHLESLRRLVVSYRDELSACICVFPGWTAARAGFVQSLAKSGLNMICMIVCRNRRETEGRLARDPAPCRCLLLEVGSIASQLMSL